MANKPKKSKGAESSKECPSCGATLPASIEKCSVCSYDFNVKAEEDKKAEEDRLVAELQSLEEPQTETTEDTIIPPKETKTDPKVPTYVKAPTPGETTSAKDAGLEDIVAKDTKAKQIVKQDKKDTIQTPTPAVQKKGLSLPIYVTSDSPAEILKSAYKYIGRTGTSGNYVNYLETLGAVAKLIENNDSKNISDEQIETLVCGTIYYGREPKTQNQAIDLKYHAALSAIYRATRDVVIDLGKRKQVYGDLVGYIMTHFNVERSDANKILKGYNKNTHGTEKQLIKTIKKANKKTK